ncbi:MAG: ribokinase, partial [Lachnospiraceae bacterium]|nr:ribokinase [Lachnospiraceae bacterium]
MRILDLGSANYDYVYSVDHLAAPGETVSALGYNRYFGGKGLNQAVAIARAEEKVMFAGHVGSDGEDIEKLCDETGIDRTCLERAKVGT